MRRLPRLNPLSSKETIVTSFGPLSEKVEREGYIKEIENMSGENFPQLKTREPYKRVGEAFTLLGVIENTPYTVRKTGDGVHFYDGEKAVFTLSDTPKQMAIVNDMVVIFPDKKYYSLLTKKAKRTFNSLYELNEATESLGATAGDIYLAGNKIFSYVGTKVSLLAKEPLHPEKAKAWEFVGYTWGDLGFCEEVATEFSHDDKYENKIRATKGFDKLYGIKVGDYIYVKMKEEGDETKYYEFNVKVSDIVSREKEVVFYFGDFDFPVSYASVKSVTFERRIPLFSHIASHNERLIGVSDETIYVSKLREPWAFFDYELNASSAFAVRVAGAEFTGAVVYNSHPTFFTENAVYKLYGAIPAEYTIISQENIEGVEKSSSATLKEVGGVLYYIGKTGLFAYSGTYPKKVSDAVTLLVGGTAVADGDDYIFAQKENIYRYMTKKNMFFVEINSERSIECSLFKTDDIYIVSDNGCYTIKGGDEVVTSHLLFHPFYDNTLAQKGIMKIRVRASVKGKVTVYIKDEEKTHLLGELTDGITTFTLKRRTGAYSLLFKGEGDWTLYSIERVRRKGSDKN